MPEIHALAASAPKGRLEPFSYTPGPPDPEHLDIAVEYCGLCHSDLSMLNNDFGSTTYPFVPGHEVVGKVVAAGDGVKRVKVGDTVGLGWYSASCMFCPQCLSGNHNLCPTAEQTIVGRPGGFATQVRCHWSWATPIPAGVDITKAGPLFCGGITVFNPIVQLDIKPTARVGVIGIGGLGHMALQFLNKWGCEVTAFTSSASKSAEAKKMGAHKVVDSSSAKELKSIRGSLDFILSTVAVNLDWNAYFSALAPKGHFHVVGVIPAPISVPAFTLIGAQKSISGTPMGSPFNTARMLDFSARHGINAVTEEFPMSQANEALEHLEAGKARYRIVLKNDLK
jgi:alcohol/geraniol dehydrogenase (NADP+)